MAPRIGYVFGIKSFVLIYFASCFIVCVSSKKACDPWTQYPQDTNNVVAPVVFYQSGPGGRPQYMKATLKKSEIDNYKKIGSSPDSKVSLAVRENGEKARDQAGHLLAARLGGSGKDPRNLFPQNANCNMGAWKVFPEDDVATLLAKNDNMEYSVKLFYKDDKAKRPYKIAACYSTHNNAVRGNDLKNVFYLDNPLYPGKCSNGPAGFGKIIKSDFDDPFFDNY